MQSTQPNPKSRLDLAAVREKLAGKRGEQYWRTLEEVADTPEFQTFLEDEFPNRSTLLQLNRRDLLKFMGASLALAGLSGCRSVFLPEDKVVPYVRQPEELVQGLPLYYASTMVRGGYGVGVLVEQHEGRPIRCEGNPDHPASLGSIDVFSQAEVLSLYEPDRAQSPTQQGDFSTWPTFSEAMRQVLAKQAATGGAGVRILTGAVTSPTFAGLMSEFLAKYPAARWHAWEPVGKANAHEGARLAYGSPLNTVYDFRPARVVVSLDSDFLNQAEDLGALRYARDFTNGRRVQGHTGTMNRLYSIGSTPSLVSLMADHHWPVKASEVYTVAAALASALGVAGAPAASVSGPLGQAIGAMVRDLQANRGACVVVAGDHQSPAVHALAQAMNEALGNVGTTVRHTAPVEATAASRVGDLRSLTEDLNAGRVDVLLVLDSNPVYTAPADLGFAQAFPKARLKVHLSSIPDETSALCDWHLPLSHSLEAWGDARAYDGTASIVQPLIAPLWDTRSPIEVIADMLGKPRAPYDLVRAHWQSSGLGSDFEKSWRVAVHDGVIRGSALPAVRPVLTLGALPPVRTGAGTEIIFRTDPSIYDGRYANNGWLQELPKPVSKMTWDNVVMVSPKQALALNVEDDDLVRLDLNGRSVIGAVFVQPGHPQDSVTVTLGYGRTAGGTVATVTGDQGGGFNAYALRTSDAMGFAQGLTITKIGGAQRLATTQGHQPLTSDRIADDRDVIREGTLAEFLAGKSLRPPYAPDSDEIKEQNLYPEEVFEWHGPQWGMTIDLNTCIGCNACVVACQSENNISVVGKEQVGRHREMHWLRIDRYYKGDSDNPQATWQPLMCVHCEKAPCEPVCPVAATVHSHEGLNQMVYNRCVGTRYCSNNCPYKVRRFNYLNWAENQPGFSEREAAGVFNQHTIPGALNTPKRNALELLSMVNNPDVTVRGRGVMEKCTYCVQRINNARQEAKKAGRDIRDGEIVTACQQACPTQTIVFGNVADRASAVSRLRNDPRSYLLLEELQTRPRTTYLAKLRNPNPEIASEVNA